MSIRSYRYYRRLNRKRNIGLMIETWVNDTNIPFKALGAMFGFSATEAARLITMHWLPRRNLIDPVVIVKQSKMNEDNQHDSAA